MAATFARGGDDLEERWVPYGVFRDLADSRRYEYMRPWGEHRVFMHLASKRAFFVEVRDKLVREAELLEFEQFSRHAAE